MGLHGLLTWIALPFFFNSGQTMIKTDRSDKWLVLSIQESLHIYLHKITEKLADEQNFADSSCPFCLSLDRDRLQKVNS
jgi:hypothetical protein